MTTLSLSEQIAKSRRSAKYANVDSSSTKGRKRFAQPDGPVRYFCLASVGVARRLA